MGLVFSVLEFNSMASLEIALQFTAIGMVK